MFVLLLGSGYSQTEEKVALQVMAKCERLGEVNGQEMTILFEENRNKCDPEIGYLSIEDLLQHFFESLEAINIDKNRFERSIIKSDRTKIWRREYYSIRGTIEEIKSIEKIVEDQLLTVEELRPTFVEYKLEDQDERAICAINRAVERANIIANNLGYKNCVLVSVDDDTSSALDLTIYVEMLLSMPAIEAGGSTYSIVGNFEMY